MPIEGMTLRDWFAGMALAGHIASTSSPEAMTLTSAAAAKHGFKGKEELFMAKVAYTFAEAMLLTRESGEG